MSPGPCPLSWLAVRLRPRRLGVGLGRRSCTEGRCPTWRFERPTLKAMAAGRGVPASALRGGSWSGFEKSEKVACPAPKRCIETGMVRRAPPTPPTEALIVLLLPVYLRCTGGEVGATSALAPKIGPLGLVSLPRGRVFLVLEQLCCGLCKHDRMEDVISIGGYFFPQLDLSY